MDMQTPFSKAQGHGTAKKGVGSYIGLRISSLALAILAPIVIWFLLYYMGEGRSGLLYWLGQPLGAGIMILFLTATFYHMRLGLDEVIHDYLQKPITKITCLIANLFLCTSFWLTGVFSVLLIAVKGH